MNKCTKFAVYAGIILAFGFSACKSNDVPETPAPVEEKKEDFSQANKDLLSQVDTDRNAAIEAGAQAVNPAGYAAAEAEYNAEKAAVENSQEDLSMALKDLSDRYNGLACQARAKTKKDRIDSLGFASYDQTSYDNGAAILNELSTLDGNVLTGSVLKQKASNAESSFDKVLTTAFKSLAKDERTAAFFAKRNADSVKASVSRKETYDAGVNAFRSGDQNYSTGNPEEAYKSYTQSKVTFEALYAEISDARSKAQMAIDAAKQRVADADTVAQKADEVAPLGEEKIEGIEDADTKLLQEDTYASAEDTAVEIEEVLAE